MLMLANPGTVFFSCLTVVLGELSSFFFMAFWMGLFMRQGLPMPILWPAIKVSGFFWQRPNSSQSGLRHLDLVPDGLDRHLALQSSMATLFSSLEKCLLVFAHMAVIDWQMQSGFLHYIHCQNGISLPRMMKIGTEHPNKQENKMHLSPGS
jgi:hypothetical protein